MVSRSISVQVVLCKRSVMPLYIVRHNKPKFLRPFHIFGESKEGTRYGQVLSHDVIL